jgi:hypothetical protein
MRLILILVIIGKYLRTTVSKIHSQASSTIEFFSDIIILGGVVADFELMVLYLVGSTLPLELCPQALCFLAFIQVEYYIFVLWLVSNHDPAI